MILDPKQGFAQPRRDVIASLRDCLPGKVISKKTNSRKLARFAAKILISTTTAD